MSPNLRLAASVLPAIALFAVAITVVTVVDARLPGGLGLVLGLVAAVAAVLGVLLVYWNAVDWSNMAILRRSMAAGDAALQHGKVVAVEGVARTRGEPLQTPFDAVRCAAYTYRVTSSRRNASGDRRRVDMAQGLHLAATRIENGRHRLALDALPGFEDELREEIDVDRHREEIDALFGRLAQGAATAGQREPQARLLAARAGTDGELHHDYLVTPLGTGAEDLAIEQECLPVDTPVCVIGTYDAERQSLTARHARIGHNLMVYRGSADEVVARVGADVGRYFKVATWLLATAALILLAALAPPAWLGLVAPLS